MSHALSFSNVASEFGGPEEPCFIYRFNDEEGSGPELVRDVFIERGMTEFQPLLHRENEWNIWWKGSQFRGSFYSQIKPWQRLNHHPKAKGSVNDITSKDGLSRNMRRMKGIYNDVFNFTPVTFHLPREERLFKDTFSKLSEGESSLRDNIWIYKPADMSRGRGIFVFNQLIQLRYGSKSIVQRYITNPFLISGYKFDLRLYAVVVSYRPLVVYLLNDGIVRFSTERFDLSSLDNVYSHLTNTSINKFGPSYATKKVGIGAGCKWSLAQLRYYLYQKEINDRKLWSEIINIINLTILSQASSIPKVFNCYELFGFDIMFDADLKPWLLEVNFSPAMKYDCAVDSQVKKLLVNSVCDLMGFTTGDVIGGNNSPNRSLDQFLEPRSGGPGWTRERARTRWEAAREPKTCKPPPLYRDNRTAGERNISNNHPLTLSRRRILRTGDEESRLTDSGFSSASSSVRGRRGSANGSNMSSVGYSKLGKPSSSITNNGHGMADRHSTGCMESIVEDSDTENSRLKAVGSTLANDYRLPTLSHTAGSNRQVGANGDCSRDSGVPSSAPREHLSLPIHLRTRPSNQSGLRLTASYCKKESLKATANYRSLVSGRNGRKQQPQRPNRCKTFCDDRDGDSSDEEEADNQPSMMGSTESDREKTNTLPVNLLYGVHPMRHNSSDRLPTLAHNYGSLKLIFPFNKATRRAATILDERSIVRECVRLLKYRCKEGTTHSANIDTLPQEILDISDVPEVWTPL